MATIKSPCTSVCRLDATSGWCLGCGRTGDEIAVWMAASDGQKRTILARLPARMTALAGQGALRRRRGS